MKQGGKRAATILYPPPLTGKSQAKGRKQSGPPGVWNATAVTGTVIREMNFAAPPLWEVEPHIHFSNQRSHVTAEEGRAAAPEDRGRAEGVRSAVTRSNSTWENYPLPQFQTQKPDISWSEPVNMTGVNKTYNISYGVYPSTTLSVTIPTTNVTLQSLKIWDKLLHTV
ncbi:unnamed protein product [Ranitomeya imitator]|uniref:Uncharacterized protein n=1 Tax=Ranitomeya imitator TaxID=111125 RepID=A0ABN9LI77_9NEOB|nr:unnamed protein product [Ranitomeya imitator]